MKRLRQEIDQLDRTVLDLLNQRVRLVLEIGHYKRNHDLPIYDPIRESLVLQSLQEANEGPLDSEAVRRIFERLIDESRRIESHPPIPGDS